MMSRSERWITPHLYGMLMFFLINFVFRHASTSEQCDDSAKPTFQVQVWNPTITTMQNSPHHSGPHPHPHPTNPTHRHQTPPTYPHIHIGIGENDDLPVSHQSNSWSGLLRL
jgi:hypothetical protein